jgi:putative MATE family efflux protein
MSEKPGAPKDALRQGGMPSPTGAGVPPPRLQRVDMTQGPIAGKLTRLAAPLIAGNILQTVYNLVDMFWVGQLGAESVAAVAIVFPTEWLLISVAMGVTIAGAALVSQWTGAGRRDLADFMAAQTTLLAAIISTLLAGVAYALRLPLLAFLGATGPLLQPTLEYVSVIFWAVPFTFLFMAYRSTLQGAGDTIRPMYLVTASNLLNMVLDPLLIFGLGPFPALGVAGAAWATLISRMIVAVIGIGWMFSGRLTVTLKVRNLIPHGPTIRQILRIGIPGGIDGAAMSFSAVALIAIVTRFGPVATAAYGIGVRVMSLVWTISGAVGQGTATGVGQNLGAKQPDRARRVAYTGALGTLALVGLAGVGAALFAPSIMAVFVDDPDVIAEGVRFLRISGWGFGFGGATMAIQGAFQGAGRTNYSMVLSILNRWLLRLPVAMLLAWSLRWGSMGIWWSFLISDVMGFLVGFAWLQRGQWQQQLTQEAKGEAAASARASASARPVVPAGVEERE